MKSAVNQNLSDDFKNHYQIKSIVNVFEWTQKKVFVVDMGEWYQVIKIFKNFNKRDIREIWIYEKFKLNKGLPKLIKVDSYGNDTIVFEEYIEGQTLEENKDKYYKNHILISELIRDIVDILIPIWDEDIIHRDLAPKNIIISPDWKPNVIDFWIAKDLTASTLTDLWFQPNTPCFASPEQLTGKKELIWYRSDFFSLGIIAYYLYYWEYPFWLDIYAFVENIKKGTISFLSEPNCPLNSFFNSTLWILPTDRPRNTKLLLSLLS